MAILFIDRLKVLFTAKYLTVAKCPLNENGRFSAQLGVAKLSLKVKTKITFSGERQTISRKKYHLFAPVLGPSYMQKTSKFELCSSFAEKKIKLTFCLIFFCGHLFSIS